MSETGMTPAAASSLEGRMREFLQGTRWLNFGFLAPRTRGDCHVLSFHGICSSVSRKWTLSQLVNDISPGRSQHRSTRPHHSLDTPSSWHSPFCIDVILLELFPCPQTVWEVESRAHRSLWYAQHLLLCLEQKWAQCILLCRCPYPTQTEMNITREI